MYNKVADNNDERVLVLASSGRDASLTCRLLADSGLVAETCVDVAELCLKMREGAGVVIAAEEVLPPDLGPLVGELRAAANWSDLPMIVLGASRSESESGRYFISELATQINVTLLERPVRPWTLVSAVRVALRARRRQYEVRDFMLERERSAESLRQAEERLRAAQQAANSGVWEWNLVTGESLLSEECFHIWGLEPQAGPVAYDWFAMMHPDDRKNARDVLDAVVERDTPLQIEYRILLSDGEVRWLMTHGRAVARDASGRATRLSGITLDVTARKQMELEWQEARGVAEAANCAKSQFLANVSHELRTPMTAILGMTEVALEEELSPTVRDQLETVKGAADSLLTLLNDLLDLSRVESGKIVLEQAPFKLREVLSGTIKLLRGRAQEKGLTLGYEVFYQVPDHVLGDSFRLRQVLTNLVGNAIKFTEQGEVAVRVSLESQTPSEAVLRFSVSDTGMGIPHDSLERIFAPFSQLDASTARTYGGTGLGLALSRNMVAMMGGRLWVESEVGRGSTFHFTARFGIPTEQAAPPVAPRQEPALVKVDAQGATVAASLALRVLLAEDNPANQKLMQYILTKHGHTVEVVGNGHQAVERIEREDFDVVLMDVQMPVMDGFKATAAIRALPNSKSRLPIIAMTANASKEDECRCLSAGMTDYLSKPFGAQELLSRLSKVAPHKAGSAAEVREQPAGARSGIVPADSSPPVFDRAEALRHCYDQEQHLRNMMESFFTDSPQLLARMRAALDKGDSADLAAAAHRLKGTTIYLGAALAQNAAQHVEQIGISGDLSEAAEAIAGLEHEVRRLEECLTEQCSASQ